MRIEDVEFDEGCLMNKQKFKSGKFAGSLRRRLMREHLGRLLLFIITLITHLFYASNKNRSYFDITTFLRFIA